MTKRTGAMLVIAVFLSIAFASLLLAEGGLAPFHITLHDPWTNEVGVALNANALAMFDDDANPATVTNDTFVVHGHLGGLAGGTFSYDGVMRTLTLDPDRAFHAGEVLRVSATGGISSTGGAGLTPYGWQFTAGQVYSRCLGGFGDTGAGLTGVDRSSAAWGDYDNDGDLDILLTGWTGSARVSKVYRNDGASGLTDIGAGLTGVDLSSVAWGDYDNDGDLDILLIGSTGSAPVSTVYRNDGSDTFTEISAGLASAYVGSGAWGDYDNDGDLDILLTGYTGSTAVSQVYRNDGGGAFSDIGAGLPGVIDSSAAWGDYDNDGDLDILLAGNWFGVRVSRVYRNDGAGTFADITAGLTGVALASVAWGDYDKDFDLDILLTGVSTAGPVSQVYRNEGGGVFTDIGAGLTAVQLSSVAWGDYDNDGDLDILLTGLSAGGEVSKVYRNDGGGAFSDIGAGLTGVDFGSVAWGDADNDGDLDILLTGNGVSKVYRNGDCWYVIDHQPETHVLGVPLTAAVSATFDGDVNSSTVTSDTFVVHGHLGGLASGTFDYDAGSRTVTLDPGRAFHAGEVLRVSATAGISNTDAVPLTPYGWQFTAGPVVERGFSRFVDIGAGLTGVAYSSVAWGDYDSDGDLDLLLTGRSGSSGVSRVYRNEGGDSFTDIGAGLTDVNSGSVAWGDYDSDGDLDILLAGRDDLYDPVSKVYRNDGGGVFSDTGAVLTAVYDTSVAWGDYDNDGDLDILLTGQDSSSYTVSKVYRNDTPSGFTNIGASLTGVSNGSAAWGDVDNDGDLDILLTGSYNSKVYRNDGTPASPDFTNIGAGLTGVDDSSAAWGDYDNDGDLDILLSGHVVDYGPVSKVYRNDGTPASPAFTDIGAGLTPVWRSSAAWGDYDNDGDLDILLTGRDSANNEVSKVYRNNGDQTFSDISAGLTGVMYSSVAWGDYDNDRDLDILLTGYDGSAEVSKVYRNNSRPELGSVTPASGSGPVGVTTYFTTTWSDPDGRENLKQCYFHIGASPALAGNVTLLYNAAKDKLWLLEDNGASWLGGCQPGDLVFVLNSQAILDCSQTAVRGVGDTLGVRWAIEFRPGFEGAKKLGLKCKDRDKAKAKGEWKGTWTITSS